MPEKRVEILEHGRMYGKKLVFRCSCGCVFRQKPTSRVWSNFGWWYGASSPECMAFVRVEDERNEEEELE